MKLDIFSHCTIDEIVCNGKQIETPGGPALYCGLTAKNLKFDPIIHTKIGADFPSEYVEQNKMTFSENFLVKNPTTRFRLEISGTDRNLYLKSKCDQIGFDNIRGDGCIISPVFDEISHDTFEKIKKDSKFILLDPQGFLRRKDNQNKIFLEKTEMNLSKVSAIKVDTDEAYVLTGQTGKDAMILLQKRGVGHVLFTNKREITVLVKDKFYYLKIPNIEVFDTTGIGDIFCATFACTYLKEKDFFWAMCFAVGAAQAALETKQTGLSKIPQRGAIETNASYLYNLVKFSQI